MTERCGFQWDDNEPHYANNPTHTCVLLHGHDGFRHQCSFGRSIPIDEPEVPSLGVSRCANGCGHFVWQIAPDLVTHITTFAHSGPRISNSSSLWRDLGRECRLCLGRGIATLPNDEPEPLGFGPGDWVGCPNTGAVYRIAEIGRSNDRDTILTYDKVKFSNGQVLEQRGSVYHVPSEPELTFSKVTVFEDSVTNFEVGDWITCTRFENQYHVSRLGPPGHARQSIYVDTIRNPEGQESDLSPDMTLIHYLNPKHHWDHFTKVTD